AATTKKVNVLTVRAHMMKLLRTRSHGVVLSWARERRPATSKCNNARRNSFGATRGRRLFRIGTGRGAIQDLAQSTVDLTVLTLAAIERVGKGSALHVTAAHLNSHPGLGRHLGQPLRHADRGRVAGGPAPVAPIAKSELPSRRTRRGGTECWCRRGRRDAPGRRGAGLPAGAWWG